MFRVKTFCMSFKATIKMLFWKDVADLDCRYLGVDSVEVSILWRQVWLMQTEIVRYIKCDWWKAYKATKHKFWKLYKTLQLRQNGGKRVQLVNSDGMEKLYKYWGW